MQTNEYVDLAIWLTSVWDEEERLAKSGDWGVRSGSKLIRLAISAPEKVHP